MSAGALGTPQVLERSGVGRREVLERCGVEVVNELEGVGESYQGEQSLFISTIFSRIVTENISWTDHQLLLYPYKTSLDDSETIDNILSGRKDFVKALEAKDPQLGWNSVGKSYGNVKSCPQKLTQHLRRMQ